jgi:glycosyltransferase involved in cell wall biosynthesis
MMKSSEIDQQYSTTRFIHKVDPANVADELNLSRNSESEIKVIPRLKKNSKRIDEGGLRTDSLSKKDSAERPLISIITVVYNGAQLIEDTILSVLNQTYDNIEYIVIDGASSDGTLELIRNYGYAIDYYVSEKDSGIYDAMNKGVSLAFGKWIYFLNCGDVLFDKESLSDASDYLDPDKLIIHFNCFVRDNNGREVKVRPYPTFPDSLEIWPCVQHQSVLCHASLMRRLGGYDVQWHILADYDFFVRAHINGVKIHPIQSLKICIYNSEGVSASKNSIPRLKKELKSIQVANFGKFNRGLQFQLSLKYILLSLPCSSFLEKIIRGFFLDKR